MKGFDVDYDQRLESLIARRTETVELRGKAASTGMRRGDVERYRASPIYEVYSKLGQEGSAVRYAVGAMARIDPKYTEITYEEGNRVRDQLDRALLAADAACEFEYQGSVTNDTHIKSYSDIDLLAITCRFWTLEPPQKPSSSYDGDPVEDLKLIRSTSGKCLREAFPAADVDESGGKSINICGGSLCRKIDVVPANWYDTNAYAQSQAKRDRAIQVLNVNTGERSKNTPFLHNYLIDVRDRRAVGGLRKVIRLMKSLKYDSESISLSSYDLVAIAYSMPEHQLRTIAGEEIALLARLKNYLDRLALDADLRTELSVPDESRKVFADGHATIEGLDELRVEVDDLVEAVCSNRQKSFAALAEARVTY